MENKIDEKAINEEIKEVKEKVNDKIEAVSEKTKNVIVDMRDRYNNASPAMQKTIIAIVAAIIASIVTMIKLAVLNYCVFGKRNTTNK